MTWRSRNAYRNASKPLAEPGIAPLSDNSKLRVAVVGAGAFGRNHARVYRELQQQGEAVELAAIVDTDLERATALARQFGAHAYPSVDQCLRETALQAASVAVPTLSHLEIARSLMEAGVDVLIEKPVAATLEQADELIALARRTGRIAQVGHLERFNPAVRATIPLLTRPMFFEVHRLSVFGPRALDVDVVLDLMIHDLDIVLTFARSPVREIRAVGLPILSAKVDIANVRVEFESGCVANFTASRVSTERVRKLRFFQPRQYISIDYSRQDVLVFSVGGNRVADAHIGALAQAAAGTGKASAPGAAVLAQAGVGMSKPPVAQEEPLRAELKSFLTAVRRRSAPEVGLEDGRNALELALAILHQIQEHTARFGLQQLRR